MGFSIASGWIFQGKVLTNTSNYFFLMNGFQMCSLFYMIAQVGVISGLPKRCQKSSLVSIGQVRGKTWKTGAGPVLDVPLGSLQRTPIMLHYRSN